MSGNVSIELLIRAQAEQARREVASTTVEVRALTTAATDLDQKGGVAGGGLKVLADASGRAATMINGAGAAVAGSAVEFTSFVATAGRAATAIGGVQSSVTGLTTNLASQTTELIAARQEAENWQAALDQTRARFSPLFAVSRQYEQELRDIADAERMGAISTLEAAGARDRAAASMGPLNQGMRQAVVSSGAARAANTNLIAQWNDIGMMMAAGQSPMMLALQQGTQVSQALSSLGGGKTALRAVGSSLVGLLNPMNLATIGFIGLGAAGVQWLMSLHKEAKSLEDQLAELEKTTGRVKDSLNLLGDTRLEEKFGNLTGSVRGLAGVMLELDRASELKQLKTTLDELLKAKLDPTFWQLFNQATAANGAMGTPVSTQDQMEGANYAAMKTGNTYDDYKTRRASLEGMAKQGDVAGVTGGIADLAKAMTGGGAVTDMSESAQTLLLTLAKVATKTAEIEAQFNGSAKAARLDRESNLLVQNYRQQAEVSQTVLQFGQDSVQVEQVRNKQARDALTLRLKEMGVIAGSAHEQEAFSALSAAQAADDKVSAAARKKSQDAILTDLGRQLAVSDAIAIHGENSAEVEAVRTAQAKEMLSLRLKELGATQAQIDAAMTLLEAERKRAKEARDAAAIRDSNNELAGLKREADINSTILEYGKDSLIVKQMQIAAARAEYVQQLSTLQISDALKASRLAAWDIARGMNGADPFGNLSAAREMLKTQGERIDQLRLEQSLIGVNEAAQRRILALHAAELEIQHRGLDASGAVAAQIRDGAIAEAALSTQVERQKGAWGQVKSAAEDAIDSIIEKLMGGDIPGALDALAKDVTKTFTELAVTNPLKNALLGTDYGTMQDVGGLKGIWARLTGQGAATQQTTVSTSGYSTPAMTVTAGSVSINGGANIAANANGMPGATVPHGGLAGSGDVQSQVWNYFAGKGLKPHQIAGIMGNVSAESGFNPQALGDAGAAHGLFQWNDRSPQLFGAIGGQGNLGNVQAQLEFAWHELQTSENGALQNLMASTNVKDATAAFAGFERPRGYTAANPTGADGFDRRWGAAEAALTKFSATTEMTTQSLGSMGSGFDVFGSFLSKMLGGGAGGAEGGDLLSSLLSATASSLKIPGFALGGPTGGSNPTQVRGFVHGAEYVFDAASTARIGVGTLDAMRSGKFKGYANGGFVGSVGTGLSQAMQISAPVIQFSPVINPVNNSSVPLNMDVQESTDARGQRQYNLVMSDAVAAGISAKGGKADRAFRSKYGIKRSGTAR